MITRGHYIGEMIDELAAIGAQVRMRNQLGMTDLSVIAENFFRDLLNPILNADLINLNQTRSNEPGLDLGDSRGAIAIQVTATSGKQKVEDTLSKITPTHQKKYKRFVVLVIGKKQGSYALDAALERKIGFTRVDDIWDLEDVARLAVGLDIARLEAAHRVLRKEVARLKVELEVPDAQGNYPTNGYAQWEVPAEPKIGTGKKFAKYSSARSGQPMDPKLSDALSVLAAKLKALPRVTREFLVVLLERQVERKSRRFDKPWMTLLYDKVKREYRGEDLEGELGLLDEAGFVEFRGDEVHTDGSPEIGVWIPSKCDELKHEFMDFVAEKKLNLRKVIGEVDLSAF